MPELCDFCQNGPEGQHLCPVRISTAQNLLVIEGPEIRDCVIQAFDVVIVFQREAEGGDAVGSLAVVIQLFRYGYNGMGIVEKERDDPLIFVELADGELGLFPQLCQKELSPGGDLYIRVFAVDSLTSLFSCH